MRPITVALALALALPGSAVAQLIGTVEDRMLNRRVPGAVVTVLDGTPRIIARGIADDSGRFRIAAAAGARRIRIVKLGFRPVEVSVTSGAPMRIVMERLPSLLEPVTTRDQPRCGRNATRPAAFGLWEQTRAALLETVVARETNVAQVQRLKFRRYMNDAGDSIVRMSVRMDSGRALRSFDAALPAPELLARGFARPDGPTVLFHGPDAEVLLDDALIDHYCLELAKAQADRPNQVGLRFRPMSRKVGRVDLDGTVWIDTLRRALRDMEYSYLGLDPWAERWRPGGLVSFKEVAPASVWIDRWWIRMTGASIDLPGKPPVFMNPFANVTEGGAELTSARWPDGTRWEVPLGSAEVRLMHPNGSPLAGARVLLDSTDFGGITDAFGSVRLKGLLPGPYSISVYDSTLAVVDTALPAARGFIAARDSVSRLTAMVPSLEEMVKAGCVAAHSYQTRSLMLTARIVGPNGDPVAGLTWRLVPSKGESNAARGGAFAEGVTGRDGRLYACEDLTQGQRVTLQVWPPGARVAKDLPLAESHVILRNPVTAIKVATPR